MHHDKMLYLWFAYMHKSAEQPFLATIQNSFIWIKSACNCTQKKWFLTEGSGDTEPPTQKHRGASRTVLNLQKHLQSKANLTFQLMKLLVFYRYSIFLMFTRNLGQYFLLKVTFPTFLDQEILPLMNFPSCKLLYVKKETSLYSHPFAILCPDIHIQLLAVWYWSRQTIIQLLIHSSTFNIFLIFISVVCSHSHTLTSLFLLL